MHDLASICTRFHCIGMPQGNFSAGTRFRGNGPQGIGRSGGTTCTRISQISRR